MHEICLPEIKTRHGPVMRTATEKTVNKPKRIRRKPQSFIIFDFAEDTFARQNAGKLAFALAYSYFGFAEDTPPRKKCKRACFFLSAYSYLCNSPL